MLQLQIAGRDLRLVGVGRRGKGPGFDNNKRQLQNETAGAAATHCYLLSERDGYHPQTFGAAYRCQP
jgi:hypothetical protein